MKEKSIIKYKVGDCIVNKTCIGRILEVSYDNGKPEFLVECVAVARAQVFSFHNGVVGTHFWISPLKASRVFRPAAEVDYDKAKKLVDLCDVSFQALLEKYSKDSVTK